MVLPPGGLCCFWGLRGCVGVASVSGRVRVYIDGFNLYYRGFKGTSFKWLNPVKLATSLLRPTDSIDKARYFTARVKPRVGDPQVVVRQQIYLSALATLPEIEIHYGRFLAKTKMRPTVNPPHHYVEVHDTEEKGSDANLASYLLFDAWRGEMETAIVISQDTDLLEPMRLLSQEIQMPAGLIWLDASMPSRTHCNAVTFIRHARPMHMKSAQFPNSMSGKNGQLIKKSDTW